MKLFPFKVDHPPEILFIAVGVCQASLASGIPNSNGSSSGSRTLFDLKNPGVTQRLELFNTGIVQLGSCAGIRVDNDCKVMSKGRVLAENPDFVLVSDFVKDHKPVKS